jgi:hypothetical protein
MKGSTPNYGSSQSQNSGGGAADNFGNIGAQGGDGAVPGMTGADDLGMDYSGGVANGGGAASFLA